MTIRRYNLELTTIGFVHIGDGSKIGSKEYFLKGNKTAVLDMARFVSQLNPHQMDDYCRFLERDSRYGLQDYFQDNPDLRKAANSSVLYETHGAITKTRRGTYSYYDVAAFIKDQYGLPYVPGSTVKGMIRSALLTEIILASPGKFRKLYLRDKTLSEEKNKRARACREIESEAFCRIKSNDKKADATWDIMRFVAVSDSLPLQSGDLTFAQKVDLFSRADDASHKRAMGNPKSIDYKDGNELNIYRECLKPGTKVVLEISIDSRIDQYMPQGKPLDASSLRDMLNASYDLYHRRFELKYDIPSAGADSSREYSGGSGKCQYVVQSGPLEGMRCRNQAVDGTGYCRTHAEYASASQGESQVVCYIGGGSDFSAKTIINALFDEERGASETAKILYAQFPSKVDSSIFAWLPSEIREAGFEPVHMKAAYDKRGKLRKGKDDHRHWRDAEFGVSPHTLKLGYADGKLLPMGRCYCRLEEL